MHFIKEKLVNEAKKPAMNKRFVVIGCVRLIVVVATVAAAFYFPDYFAPIGTTPDPERIVWSTDIRYTVDNQAFTSMVEFPYR